MKTYRTIKYNYSRTRNRKKKNIFDINQLLWNIQKTATKQLKAFAQEPGKEKFIQSQKALIVCYN